MAKDKTLLILAGGMGSRFGGLKQIEPIDSEGNFLIDYSIFDAIRTGFNKVVFVIKKENLDIFKKTVGNRVSKFVEVDYAFQEMNSFVKNVPEGRIKPWGTAHAVLCCKDKIEGDFVIINADDFYGLDAFKTASEFIDNNEDKSLYGLIGYNVGNTLTENGAVKRGVCEVDNGFLTNIIESNVEKIDEKIIAKPLNGSEPFEVKHNDPVSMNMICFNSDFFEYLEKDFEKFLEENKDDLSKCESLIQDAMFNQIKEKKSRTKVIPTFAVWHGVTYREDKEKVVNAIKDLIDLKLYKSPLWK